MHNSWNWKCSPASAASPTRRSKTRSPADSASAPFSTQPQYAPLRLADEVALVTALQSGLLDPLPLELIDKLRAELPAWLDRSAKGIVDAVQRSGEFNEAKAAELRAVLADFITQIAHRPSASSQGMA